MFHVGRQLGRVHQHSFIVKKVLLTSKMPKKFQISQEAFDAAVQENIDEFGMELEEAISDAIETFKIQGADLTGTMSLMVAFTFGVHIQTFGLQCRDCYGEKC